MNILAISMTNNFLTIFYDFIISFNLLIICFWLAHDSFLTFQWLAHNLQMTFAQLAHEFPMACPWLAHDLPKMCLQLSYDLPKLSMMVIAWKVCNNEKSITTKGFNEDLEDLEVYRFLKTLPFPYNPKWCQKGLSKTNANQLLASIWVMNVCNVFKFMRMK